MNWDRIEGALLRAKGKLEERWGKLMHDEAEVSAGQRDQLIGTLQHRYGKPRWEVVRLIDDFERRIAL